MRTTLYHEDGSETELPTRWEICGSCQGEGTSSAYLGAFTRDELWEQGDEWVEDYMAGRFDRACDECRGSGKVKVADLDRMTAEQVAAYKAQQESDAEYEAMCAAERRMGA